MFFRLLLLLLLLLLLVLLLLLLPTNDASADTHNHVHTCSLSEMPRTGPRWMRFIKCCSDATETSRV
jgi:hypothetical protein